MYRKLGRMHVYNTSRWYSVGEKSVCRPVRTQPEVDCTSLVARFLYCQAKWTPRLLVDKGRHVNKPSLERIIGVTLINVRQPLTSDRHSAQRRQG